MGYRNQLWTSNYPEPGCLRFADTRAGVHTFLEAGNFRVPLMWTMCFSGADVNVCQIPADQAPEPDRPYYGASCDSPRQVAVERLERRLSSLKRLIDPVHHEACGLFVARLKGSTKAFVHLNITDLLLGEDDPGDGSWKKLWADLLDGLDEPITRVRTGIIARIIGLGLPSSWKYLAYHALDRQKLRHMALPELETWALTGETLEGLREWEA